MYYDIKTPDPRRIYSEDFLLLFCEKNYDNTLHLRFKGNELFKRIGQRVIDDEVQSIVDFLKKHKNIISVDLSYNDITDAGIKKFAEYFDEDNNLEYLCLMQNSITGVGLNDIAMGKFLKLQTLRINGNKIGSNGSRFIAKILENCTTLLHLDISETDQTHESINAILMTIEDTKIRHLNISRIIPSSYYSKCNDHALAYDVATLLCQNDYLQELHLQKCEFDGHDVFLLHRGLIRNNLKLLDLSTNFIGSFGAECLSEWLKTGPKLELLNLCNNAIGDRGAKILSKGLTYSNIRVLILVSNNLSESGLLALLHTIKKCRMMRIFHIWGNTFTVPVNIVVDRLVRANVLEQEYIDVKISWEDGVPQACYYPRNIYKKRTYNLMKYNVPPTLKIIHRKLTPEIKAKLKVDYLYYQKYPPVPK